MTTGSGSSVNITAPSITPASGDSAIEVFAGQDNGDANAGSIFDFPPTFGKDWEAAPTFGPICRALKKAGKTVIRETKRTLNTARGIIKCINAFGASVAEIPYLRVRGGEFGSTAKELARIVQEVPSVGVRDRGGAS